MRSHLFVAAWWLLSSFALSARAGLGPQNVALIVNANSPASITLANEYVDARHVPPSNIIFIDLPKEFVEIINVDDFRKLILQPVFDAIKTRELAGQIDCILYSADFPHAVRLETDVAGRKLPKVITPTASINGLTYLYEPVLRKDIAYLSLNINRYAPVVHNTQPIKMPPPRGFRSDTGWLFDGKPFPKHPERGYMLSMVLGITAGRGNTVEEIREMIRRSVAADGTAPKGTIYFSINDDIRARTRQWGFVPAAAKLKELGVAAEIAGALPNNKKDVAGAMVGVADFNWKLSGSTILPGAIAEHLTSTGGVMANYGQQTPISAWIRAGASGTSGTVTEPFAIQEKFPSPFIHVYYAAGCTLAEAFYQSVSGPYQLLILGDPLCRPWGVRPEVAVKLEPGATLKGTVAINPTCKTAGFAVDHYEVFVNGRRQMNIPPGQQADLDTTRLADGHHELRLVAVGADGIQTQGHLVLPVNVDNHGAKLVVTAQPGKVEMEVGMEGAKRIILTHLGRPIATVEGAKGVLKPPADALGTGVVTLAVSAVYDAGGFERTVIAAPVRLEIPMK